MEKKTTWRLILSPEGERGAWNMALDEALLKSTAENKLTPTLRVYHWQPPTLSLGFAQPAADVDLAKLKAYGGDLVRRPTGGRAIMHIDELTYSVTATADEPQLAGDLLESYHKISQALLAGLSKLGIIAAGDKIYNTESSTNLKNPVCFETPSNYEITANARKLIGSAQARKCGGILQHGALPIQGDITRITRVLRFDSDEQRASAASKLSTHAINLEGVLRYVPEWMKVAEAIVDGFAESFGISLYESQPDPDEIELARKLMTEKYLSDTWTYRM